MHALHSTSTAPQSSAHVYAHPWGVDLHGRPVGVPGRSSRPLLQPSGGSCHVCTLVSGSAILTPRWCCQVGPVALTALPGVHTRTCAPHMLRTPPSKSPWLRLTQTGRTASPGAWVDLQGLGGFAVSPGAGRPTLISPPFPPPTSSSRAAVGRWGRGVVRGWRSKAMENQFPPERQVASCSPPNSGQDPWEIEGRD